MARSADFETPKKQLPACNVVQITALGVDVSLGRVSWPIYFPVRLPPKYINRQFNLKIYTGFSASRGEF
jgi:hypothetical protein